jgi:sporulation protein YlmC with PRC-barrel domain
MTPTFSRTLLITALAMVSLVSLVGNASAQVAGSTTTTLGVTVTESTQMALGWSVKKSILGKTVYNELGDKVGKVEDLIVAPDKGVSYLIIGAGGFIGMGRHDVAIPVTQVQDKAGKLVMAGATKDTIKAMPAFDYASDTAQRDRFIAAADSDIAKAKAKLVDLQKKASEATADAKTKLDVQVAELKVDLKTAEDKLTELKNATVKKWKAMEASVSASMARVRKAI